jgi:hypothetical protein
MNRIAFKTLLALLFIATLYNTPILAQNFPTPVSYLSFLGKQQEKINKDFWDYTSSIAHSNNARKVENRRIDLIKTTMEAINTISKLPDYNGDPSLRDSMVTFLKINYYLLTEDFAKLVNMEEIAEQSFDDMEAYMMAKDKANKKLEIASENLSAVVDKFAKDYKITIIENADKVTKKLIIAGKAFTYYNPIYLLFFKSYKQEAYLLDALKNSDFVALEQSRKKLAEITATDIKTVDLIPSFKNDFSVKNACKQLISFYNLEATKKIPIITDFYLKKEKFDRIKAEVEGKDDMTRTKEDIVNYNKALAEFNKAVNDYNRTNKELFETRNKLIANWNQAVGGFMDKHIPKN